MATTEKDGSPAKERPSRSSLTPATVQNPRARPTLPSSPATSEKDGATPTSARKPTPNYLKPTFSSGPDAAKLAKAARAAGGTRAFPQKSLHGKKGLDAKHQPQRSSSFNPPRAQKPALASRSSFSERAASKGKASGLSRIKVDRDPGRRPGGSGPRSKCSSTASSCNASATSSPKAGTEGTMSSEDKEAALNILNLDVEEHVLLEIPLSVVDKATLLEEEPAHEEEHKVAEEPPAAAAFVEEEHVGEDGSHEQPPQENESDDNEEAGKKKDEDAAAVEDIKDHEEVPTTEEAVEKEDAEKPEEAEENAVVEGPGGEPDGENQMVSKVECEDGAEKENDGVDGRGERVKLWVGGGIEEEAAPAEEKRKAAAAAEPAPQPGKKEVPPAYNDVIEETASKLVEKRKSKVKALVGAFETVIEMDSARQTQ